MAEYSDIPQGFAPVQSQQFSDVPQGFAVRQMPQDPQTQAAVRSGELPALPGEAGRRPFVGPAVPPPTKTEAVMRQLGLAGRGVTQAATDLAYMPFDAAASVYNAAQPAGGYEVTRNGQRVRVSGQIPTASQQRDDALTAAGVPTPQTPAENVGNVMLRSSLGAGGSAKIVGQIGTGPVAQAFAAQPGLQLASGATGGASAGVAREMGAGPVGQVAAGIAGGMVPYVTPRPTAVQLPRRRPVTPEDVVRRSTDGRSAGAAAAATNVADASDDLRRAIVATGGRRGQINNEALRRHVEADTLPVPIRLTAGEATQDAVALSLERNLRGKHPQMVERMAESNRALGQNMQALRDQVGPEVFSTNPVEHGDTLIRAYRQMDARVSAEVDGLYRQLRESLGSRVPVDAQAILRKATGELHKRLLFDHAPPAEMATLTRLAQSRNMTFENFEALRTNLARIQRSGADGNVKAAAGVLRNALEDLPLMPGSGADRMKPIADAARAAARRRFQAIEADPAYDAAINGTVPPDKFVQRFVLGAPRDDVDLMMRTLGDAPEIRQTVSVAALDHLRDAARLSQNYDGNFSATGFARALKGLDAKANIIFDPRTAETLGKLSNVANYTTFQPRGSFVNNSNTLVASAAKYGSDVAEGVTNVAFLGVPVGTFARRGLEALGTRRTINRALRPGAGIATPRNALARQPAQNSLNRP